MATQEEDVQRQSDRPKAARAITTIVIVGAIIVYWLLARAVQGIDLRITPSPTVNNMLNDFPLLTPFLFFFELFSPTVLRHFIPILWGIGGGWLISTKLVEILYDLPDRANATHLLGRLSSGGSGGGRKPLSINRLNFSTQQNEKDLLRIGGPGYVALSESDVAVTEINGRFERVISGGRKRLRRFEKIIAVLDLREQERLRNDVTLMTKEGLELKTNLRINFHLQRRPDPRQPNNIYTFDDASVRKAAFATKVVPKGLLRWDAQPIHVVVAQLRRIVANKRLDELIDPAYIFEAAPHPRIQQMMQQDARDILAGRGIHLVSAHITSLEMSPEMHEMLITYWKTFGEKAKALDERPQDPSFDSAEIVRRRAREKMIASLTTGLQTIRDKKNATPRQTPVATAAVSSDINHLLTLELIRLLKQTTQPQQLFDANNEHSLLTASDNDLKKQLDTLLRHFLPSAK